MDPNAFPPDVRSPSKAVAVADYDGDGDMDIFIGGRVALKSYPYPSRSYILRNDHGRFTDVTEAVCPALMYPGMINAAVWADIDKDNKPDLILTGDWMSIRVFKNDGSRLTEITAPLGLGGSTGLWRSLAVADINHDGNLDIVAGNIGLNNPWHISADRPAELYAKDFDNNGKIDPIFCYYIRDEDGKYELRPGISRDELAAQVPSIKKKFSSNAPYAGAGMQDLFPGNTDGDSLLLTCNEARSGYFENNEHGKFIFHPFPMMAQIAPPQYDRLYRCGRRWQPGSGTGWQRIPNGCLCRTQGRIIRSVSQGRWQGEFCTGNSCIRWPDPRWRRSGSEDPSFGAAQIPAGGCEQ